MGATGNGGGMIEIHKFIHHHWLDIMLLPANILAIEAIVREAAVKRGYKNTVTWCDQIANAVGFIQDVLVGIIQRKQSKAEAKP